MKKKNIAILTSALLLLIVLIANAGGLQPYVYLPLVHNPPNTPTPTPTKTATPTPTKTITPTPTKTPTKTNTIPPSNTPTKTKTPTSPPPIININITFIFFDGSGSNESDEYVSIRNDGNTAVNLQNWTLSDEANHVYTFPNYTIQIGQTCRVYTNENHPEWCNFNYQSGSPIWNNGGDCATLRNASNQQVDEYCY